MIEFTIPELLYLDGGMLSIPTEDSKVQRPEGGILRNLMSIWTTDWMEKSIEENSKLLAHLNGDECLTLPSVSSPFNFARLLNMSLSDIHSFYYAPATKRIALIHEQPRTDPVTRYTWQ